MKIDKPDIKSTDVVVSYTQFSMYKTCPRHWYLAYGLNLRKREPNIHLIFGTAIHNTIQEWIGASHTSPVVGYDYESMFKEHYFSEFKVAVDRLGDTFSSPVELMEFYLQGVEILTYLDEVNHPYFSPDKYEFIGYELPIYVPLIGSVKFLAYIDLVFRNIHTGKYEVVDIKTSTSAWGTHQMSDASKLAQVYLYKKFYSKVYNVQMDDIIVEYFIVKRTLKAWDSDRTQSFVPVQDIDLVDSTYEELVEFASSVYNDTDVVHADYLANAGSGFKNCRFCDFADDEVNCPKAKRKC